MRLKIYFLIAYNLSLIHIFVGVGGQGTLLASRLLGSALLSKGYDVKVSEVHGMSQRGGDVYKRQEEPCIDIVCVFLRLVFELGHAGELAKLGVTAEQPRKLGVGGHMALDEGDALFWVDAAGQDQRKGLECAAAQLRGLLPYRQSVQVHDGVDAVVFIL